MKNKFLEALCLAIACAGAMAYSSRYSEDNPSRDVVLMENVEALSQSESGGVYLPCYASPTRKCNVNVSTASGQGVLTLNDHQKVQA